MREWSQRQWAPDGKAKALEALDRGRSQPCPPARRAKISQALAGEKTPHWLGEDVGYGGIHKRARAGLPLECALADDTCRGRLEVALRHEATGPLRRDNQGRGWYSPVLEDYWRLCRSHHNRYDGKAPPESTRFGRGALART